jgi:hypothetical protein
VHLAKVGNFKAFGTIAPGVSRQPFHGHARSESLKDSVSQTCVYVQYAMRRGIRAAASFRSRLPVPALEPFYYLKNFERVLSTIASRYEDLLVADELRFITAFRQAPLNSRALLARMVMRQGDLFRASKIEYSEIGETRAAADPLIEAGWLSDRPLLDIKQLQGLLTKAELVRCLKLPRRYTDWRKADLQAMLAATFTERRDFFDWCADAGDIVYALLVAPVCERFRLLFFGNDWQSWTEFVTADLKIFNFEKIAQHAHSRPFQTRAQIDQFQRLRECRELLLDGTPFTELVRTVPEAIEDSDWLEEERQKLIFGIAREHERAGDTEAALAIYLRCTYRGARTRAIVLKSRTRDWEGTRALCLEVKANPASEEELQRVRRILPRVCLKLGLPATPEDAAPVIPEFELVLDGTPRARAVEYLVRDHLALELIDGDTVRYVENGLINALFGLLCWPAVFAPVAGAFFHDFHRAPADLASGHFYSRRKNDFDVCFSHLESDRYRKVIWTVFKKKWGIQSPFVRWHSLDRVLLQWALDCFPAAHLRAWFEWIVRDVRENRAGFPDLVQFWPEERRYRLIEVKGPGDRVQDNQKRLLEYCIARRMPVSVCYVRWSHDRPESRGADSKQSRRNPAQN